MRGMLVGVSGLRLLRMIMMLFVLAGLSALRAMGFIRNIGGRIVLPIELASGCGASLRERFAGQQFDGM